MNGAEVSDSVRVSDSSARDRNQDRYRFGLYPCAFNRRDYLNCDRSSRVEGNGIDRRLPSLTHCNTLATGCACQNTLSAFYEHSIHSYLCGVAERLLLRAISAHLLCNRA